MRFLFFLILVFIGYYIIKYIFRNMFSSETNNNVKEKRSTSNIDKRDIIEAEFEEIVEPDKNEDEGKEG